MVVLNLNVTTEARKAIVLIQKRSVMERSNATMERMSGIVVSQLEYSKALKNLGMDARLEISTITR